jgi:hypothetical protein
MSAKGHLVARLWFALTVKLATSQWLRRWIAQPSVSFARAMRRQLMWEYAQADAQPWDTELDEEGLIAALKLRNSDPDLALSRLSALALQDSPRAMNAVGERYYWGRFWGRDIPRDEVEGMKWLKRAFERGSRRGLLSYGKLMFSKKDYGTAEMVFRRGADDDWAPALYWLARTEVARDKSLEAVLRVRPYLERAAELGSPMAAGVLGAVMGLGFYGLRHVRQGVRLVSSAFPADEPPPRETATGETVH